MRSSNDLTRNGLLDQLCGSLDERFTSGQGSFLAVIVRPGESQQEAEERTYNEACCREPPKYQLLINTREKTEAELDAEIEEVIQELKRKGVSDEEIKSITET